MTVLLERLFNFGNSLPGVLSQGLIWGIMAIGLYITYRILELSDLTVDGSFCTGGAVYIVMMAMGSPTWLAMICAFLAGMIAGFVVCVGWKLIGLPFGLGAAVPGTIACAAALVCVSLVTYEKTPSVIILRGIIYRKFSI